MIIPQDSYYYTNDHISFAEQVKISYVTLMRLKAGFWWSTCARPGQETVKVP